MSFLRRNGKSESDAEDRGVALVPYSQLKSDDGWADNDARPVTKGVWLVIKLSKGVPEGKWTRDTEHPRSILYGAIDNHSKLAEYDSGLDAIKAYYEDRLAAAPDDNPEKADGRYVALDFYGRGRVEALVVGGWKVDIAVAPERLEPPDA